MQDCSNSIANALEVLQFCTKPLILVVHARCLYLECNQEILIKFHVSSLSHLHDLTHILTKKCTDSKPSHLAAYDLRSPVSWFSLVCRIVRMWAPSWRRDRHRIVFSPWWGLLYWWDDIFVIILIMWFYWWCEESFVSSSKSTDCYDDAILIF